MAVPVYNDDDYELKSLYNALYGAAQCSDDRTHGPHLWSQPGVGGPDPQKWCDGKYHLTMTEVEEFLNGRSEGDRPQLPVKSVASFRSAGGPGRARKAPKSR